MSVPIGFCRAEVTINPNFLITYPLALGTTIQYEIGITSITGIVNISGANNAIDIQNAINSDPTYLSSGTTITISITGDLIIALITKASVSQIADIAFGTIIYPPQPFVDFTGLASFICNIAPQKKKNNYKKAFLRCVDEIIFKSNHTYLQVKYCNTIYNFYIVDAQGLLHYIKATSNISQRNTVNWRIKYLQ